MLASSFHLLNFRVAQQCFFSPFHWHFQTSAYCSNSLFPPISLEGNLSHFTLVTHNTFPPYPLFSCFKGRKCFFSILFPPLCALALYPTFSFWTSFHQWPPLSSIFVPYIHCHWPFLPSCPTHKHADISPFLNVPCWSCTPLSDHLSTLSESPWKSPPSPHHLPGRSSTCCHLASSCHPAKWLLQMLPVPFWMLHVRDTFRSFSFLTSVAFHSEGYFSLILSFVTRTHLCWYAFALLWLFPIALWKVLVLYPPSCQGPLSSTLQWAY